MRQVVDWLMKLMNTSIRLETTFLVLMCLNTLTVLQTALSKIFMWLELLTVIVQMKSDQTFKTALFFNVETYFSRTNNKVDALNIQLYI